MIKTVNPEGPTQEGGVAETHCKSGEDVGSGPDPDPDEALQAAGKHTGRLLATLMLTRQKGSKRSESESQLT